MKFTINRPAFINQLNNVLRAISSKTTIPILTGLKMVVTDHSVVLTGSDADITIESTLDASDSSYGLSIEEPGAIVLPARFFNEVIKKLPDKQATIEVFNGLQVRITSGTAEFTINGQDANNYPHLPEVESENTVELASDMLREVIDQTRIAVSKQESRPILTGVHFVLSDNKELKTVATDSHRMSQKVITLEKNGDNFDVVIPSRSLREFTSVFSDDIETVEVFFANNQILFRSEHISFYTRLLEGNYPDTDRLIPTEFNTEATFNVANLRFAMERARLLSNATQNGTVKLEFKNGVVSSHVHSPEVGRVNEEIDTSAVSGEDLSISFNPTYLIEALKAIDSEQVVIRFISSVRPFTLVPEGNEQGFIQLITPVRTN